jgi:iron complex transport system ATP-binding protein
MTAATVAQLQDVSVRLGRKRVLTEVSIDVRAGEVLAIVGPNGAGKSTALAALAGDVAPASGRVLLQGRPLPRWSPREAARQRAVLLQHSAVAFPFAAREVVRMGRAPWRGTPHEADDLIAVKEALQVMDAAHLAERNITALSGGEQARIALARALAQRTPLLLLDEPTAALDLRHAENTLGHLRHLAGAGAAVAVVLHDLNLAAAHADRVIVIDRGRVGADGPPRQVLTERVLSQCYGHPVDVVAHPRTGDPVVLARRY